MILPAHNVSRSLLEARHRLDLRCSSLQINGKSAWQRYAALIEGNFLTWLMAAYLRCGGDDSRRALLLNLEEEIIDDHPGLLRRLLFRYDFLPDISAYATTTEVLDEIRSLCAKGSPVSLLAMLAYLESCSPQFLPALADLADVSILDPYIVVHVKTDVAHAASLESALAKEMLFVDDPDGMLAKGIGLGEKLLAVVFGWQTFISAPDYANDSATGTASP